MQGRFFAYGFVASNKQVRKLALRVRRSESCVFGRRCRVRSPGCNSSDEEEQFRGLPRKDRTAFPHGSVNATSRTSRGQVLFGVPAGSDGLQTIYQAEVSGLVLAVQSDQDFKDELSRYLHCFDTSGRNRLRGRRNELGLG